MKSTVEPPPWSIHSRALAMTARTSATPLMTAESVANGASTLLASSRASVVLPDARRSPQHHRGEVAALDHAPQRAALADEVLLAHELVERLRPHARRERRVRGRAATGRAPAARPGAERAVSIERACPEIIPRRCSRRSTIRAVTSDVNLRIPGPTPLPDRVREAGARQMVNHRGPEFKELINRVTARLQTAFVTRNDILILTASGHRRP